MRRVGLELAKARARRPGLGGTSSKARARKVQARRSRLEGPGSKGPYSKGPYSKGPGSEGLAEVLHSHAIIGKLCRLELSSCSVSLKHLLSDLYAVGLMLIWLKRKILNPTTKFGLEMNSPTCFEAQGIQA